RVLLNLYLMWVSDAPMPVWIRGLLAYFRASTAVSISPLTARVRAHTVGVVTNLDISTTLLKSPGLEIGNPASIISTPSVSNSSAMMSFSGVVNCEPGTCSPSRRVVSKTYMRLGSCNIIPVFLFLLCVLANCLTSKLVHFFYYLYFAFFQYYSLFQATG